MELRHTELFHKLAWLNSGAPPVGIHTLSAWIARLRKRCCHRCGVFRKAAWLDTSPSIKNWALRGQKLGPAGQLGRREIMKSMLGRWKDE